MKKAMRRDLCIDVFKSQIYRAKRKAKEAIMGSHKEQFMKLWDYCNIIRVRNPGSLAFLHVESLIQMAVVEAELKDSWNWFLTNLLQAIGPAEAHGWTFISDRQKGLVEVFDALLPGVDHRFCVQHMQWDVTGVPCKHVVSAIFKQKLEPEEFVHKYFLEETYIRTYSQMIMPLPDSSMWPKVGIEPIMPLPYRRQLGRPKKVRKRAVDEPKKGTISTEGKKYRYKKCKEFRHNTRSCTKTVCREEIVGEGTSKSKGGRPPVNRGGRPPVNQRGRSLLGRGGRAPVTSGKSNASAMRGGIPIGRRGRSMGRAGRH
ncbi:uncharacterized protein LOC109728535 [Ananas comosus]|uniref:Uncharacterized protein LOC109728535 n=1 Tax=Ananas comosus TaxID=4615 RepID=A0A6P5H3Z5_ANACO|nr:uncharacterized protein LOC109728535 [Ananas comosus]